MEPRTYGVQIMDPGGDFTIPTLTGEWTLSEAWDGYSNYLFLFRYAASDYNNAVWNSDVKALLERAPEGTHLFFGSFDQSWSQDINGMKSRVDAALAQMGSDAQSSWATRVHYINTSGFSVSGALAASLTNSRCSGSRWTAFNVGARSAHSTVETRTATRSASWPTSRCTSITSQDPS